MRKDSSGSKRKVADSEVAVPAKRSTSVVVSEEAATMLKAIAARINAVTLDLMKLPSTDVVARGRLVAALAESQRHLNNVLGIKQRVSHDSRYTCDGIAI